MFDEIGADIGSVCLVELDDIEAICDKFMDGPDDGDGAWLKLRPCGDDCVWCDDKFKPIEDGALVLDGSARPKLVGMADGWGIDIGDMCGEWLNCGGKFMPWADIPGKPKFKPSAVWGLGRWAFEWYGESDVIAACIGDRWASGNAGGNSGPNMPYNDE